MPFFQLGDMGRRDVYAYTADKINQEGERNKKLYNSASGKHHKFSLGETVCATRSAVVRQHQEQELWIKRWKEALIARVLSDTTYEVQYVASDGTLGRKSIVHRNRLKSVRSQAQKDILAETQRRQEAALSGRLGVSDEQDSDSDGEGAGDQRGSIDIWHADGDNGSTMWNGKHRGVSYDQWSSEGGDGSCSSSTRGEEKVKFYIGSDEEDDSGEWITVCRRRGRGNMRAQDASGGGGVEAAGLSTGSRGASERRRLVGSRAQGGLVG